MASAHSSLFMLPAVSFVTFQGIFHPRYNKMTPHEGIAVVDKLRKTRLRPE